MYPVLFVIPIFITLRLALSSKFAYLLAQNIFSLDLIPLALRLHDHRDGNSTSSRITHFPLISDYIHYSNYQQTYVQRVYPIGNSVRSQVTNSPPTRL
jgi:hypothetical protein